MKAIKLVWLHGFNVTVHARTIAQVQRDILVYVNFDTASQVFDERLYSLALLRLAPRPEVPVLVHCGGVLESARYIDHRARESFDGCRHFDEVGSSVTALAASVHTPCQEAAFVVDCRCIATSCLNLHDSI